MPRAEQNIPQKNDLVGYGNVDQNNDGSVGVASSFVINDMLKRGIKSWRLVE